MAPMAPTLVSRGVAFGVLQRRKAFSSTHSYAIKHWTEQEQLIESTIKNSETYLTVHQLQMKLGAKVSKSQFRLTLGKLLYENKIMYHKGQKIIWTETDDAQEEAAKKYFDKLD